MTEQNNQNPPLPIKHKHVMSCTQNNKFDSPITSNSQDINTITKKTPNITKKHQTTRKRYVRTIVFVRRQLQHHTHHISDKHQPTTDLDLKSMIRDFI